MEFPFVPGSSFSFLRVSRSRKSQRARPAPVSCGSRCNAMRFRTRIKAFLRTRSFDFALHGQRHSPTDEARTLRHRGVLIHYRPGGSDVENVTKKLLKRESEYWLPPDFQPRT